MAAAPRRHTPPVCRRSNRRYVGYFYPVNKRSSQSRKKTAAYRPYAANCAETNSASLLACHSRAPRVIASLLSPACGRCLAPQTTPDKTKRLRIKRSNKCPGRLRPARLRRWQLRIKCPVESQNQSAMPAHAAYTQPHASPRKYLPAFLPPKPCRSRCAKHSLQTHFQSQLIRLARRWYWRSDHANSAVLDQKSSMDRRYRRTRQPAEWRLTL